MKKIISAVSVFFLSFFVLTSFTVFATPVTFTVTSYFDELNQTHNSVIYDYGSVLSLDTHLGSQANYTFEAWVINGVVEFPPTLTESFPIVGNMTAKAIFSPNDRHLAVFIDSNGKYLDHDYVVFGGTAVAAGFVEPTKPGYQVTAARWDKPLDNMTKDTLFILRYERLNADTFNIVVNNGSGTGIYAFNDIVTITADPAPTGEVFSHWVDSHAAIVSVFSTHRFTALAPRTFSPVYAASPLPLDTPYAVSQHLGLRAGRHSYLSQVHIPDGHTVIEFGVMTSVDHSFVTTADNAFYRATSLNDVTNEFLVTIPKDHFLARAFLITKDSLGVLVETYSHTITHLNTKSPLELNWENVTKGGYAAASVVIDNKNWWVADALVGSAANDRKYDNKSLRIRNQGGLTSEFAFETGISTLHFLYGLYGSDSASTIAVEYAFEWDPTLWTRVEITPGITEITVDNTALQSITVPINVNASILLRIVKLTGTQRVNIDNIIVNEAQYTTRTNPVIAGHLNATITEGDTYDPLVGVTALDYYDGDLTSTITTVTRDSANVIIPNPVNYSALAVGTYTVEFNVTDSHGATTTQTITLTVEAPGGHMPTGTELYFSEYIEGSGTGNKALEIYNPTDVAIDLSIYSVKLFANGSTTAGATLALSGTLQPGQTLVIRHNSADPAFQNKGDINIINNAIANFNGNDALELLKNDIVIDSIGQVGNNAFWGKDQTLVRKPHINSGDTISNDAFDPSIEWDSHPKDTSTFLGDHTAT